MKYWWTCLASWQSIQWFVQAVYNALRHNTHQTHTDEHTPNKKRRTNHQRWFDSWQSHILFSIKRPFDSINEMYTHSTAKPVESERAFGIMSNGGRWRIDNQIIAYQMKENGDI